MAVLNTWLCSVLCETAIGAIRIGGPGGTELIAWPAGSAILFDSKLKDRNGISILDRFKVGPFESQRLEAKDGNGKRVDFSAA